MLLVLDATTKSLQATSSAGTADITFVATYADSTSSAFVEGSSDGTIGTSATTVVASPAASTRRVIKSLNLYNSSNSSRNVTLTYNNNGTSRILVIIALDAGGSWAMDDLSGGGGISSLTVGTTPITGTNGRILYVNGSVLGELTTTGTGAVVLANLPTLTGLRLSGSTSGTITLQAPATPGTITFTFPPNTGSADQLLRTDGNGVLTWVTPAPGGVTAVTATSPVASSGGSTPAISLNSGYGDTLNPYGSKTANHVLAAPNGSSGVPSFRALVATDIPTLTQLTLAGSSSGTTTVVTSATGGGTVTIPAGTATLATTLNARSFKNVLINGDMQVAQRGTSTTGITTSGYYTADRWRLDISSLGTFTQTVETTDPAATDLTGFRQSLKMNCTTADASPAAGDYAFIQQRIEGQNVQHFLKGTSNARQFTLSFWVKSTTTGTYVAELFDNSNTRHVAATYSVSSANAWEFKTITFPADTSGVLANTNDFGLAVNFWIGSGTTYTSGTLATTWASVTNANRAAGLNVNIAGATARTFAITGVQLEPGSTATPYEYLPFDVQLARCLRYLPSISNGGSGGFSMLGRVTETGSSTTFAKCRIAYPFLVQARTFPTSATCLNGSNVTIVWPNVGGGNALQINTSYGSGGVIQQSASARSSECEFENSQTGAETVGTLVTFRVATTGVILMNGCEL